MAPPPSGCFQTQCALQDLINTLMLSLRMLLVQLTSSRQLSYCSLWLSFSRAKAEFCSCRRHTVETASVLFKPRTDCTFGAESSCSRLASQRSGVSAAPGRPIKNGQRKVRRMEVMMLNFGVAAGLWEFEANKNISSSC